MYKRWLLKTNNAIWNKKRNEINILRFIKRLENNFRRNGKIIKNRAYAQLDSIKFKLNLLNKSSYSLIKVNNKKK
jgi:hypothetical protein